MATVGQAAHALGPYQRVPIWYTNGELGSAAIAGSASRAAAASRDR
jgi:hypothetical protein